MKHKLVLFDLDGTLLDTLVDLSEAVNHALRLRGLPLHTQAEYMTMVGHGVRNLVLQALPADKLDKEGVRLAIASNKFQEGTEYRKGLKQEIDERIR